VRRVSLLLAALLLSGCAALDREGEESLVVVNADGQPIQAVIVIAVRDGGERVFSESLVLRPSESQEYALAMRPGEHTVSVTTSTSIQESVVVRVPQKGDTAIEIRFFRGGANIKTTSR